MLMWCADFFLPFFIIFVIFSILPHQLFLSNEHILPRYKYTLMQMI